MLDKATAKTWVRCKATMLAGEQVRIGVRTRSFPSNGGCAFVCNTGRRMANWAKIEAAPVKL